MTRLSKRFGLLGQALTLENLDGLALSVDRAFRANTTSGHVFDSPGARRRATVLGRPTMQRYKT
jgi:hypothetical protein